MMHRNRSIKDGRENRFFQAVCTRWTPGRCRQAVHHCMSNELSNGGVPYYVRALNKSAVLLLLRLLSLFLPLLLLAGLPGCGTGLKAQSFSEWFKQKKTQKKYLLAQIAGLRAYGRAVEKGYGIAKEGLSVVSDWKSLGFQQSSLHFSQLDNVSPAVKRYKKVQAIAQMVDHTLTCCKRMERKLSVRLDLPAGNRPNSGAFSKNDEPQVSLNDQERRAVYQILAQIIREADQDIASLELFVTGHGQNMAGLQLSDAERIHQIDQLYEAVKVKTGNCIDFTRRMTALIASRQRQLSDYEWLKSLYSVP